MPLLTIFHLTLPNGFHIGTGGVESVEESLAYIPSDTLYAALIDTWRQMGRNIFDILPPTDTPLFKITSAFPRAGEVRFFPMPVDLRQIFTKTLLQGERSKKGLKEIRYFSEGLLRKAASGEYLDEFLFPENEYDDPSIGIALQGGKLWMLAEEVKNLPADWRFSSDNHWLLRRRTVFASQNIPRVSIDRISSTTNLFQSERVMYTKDCGLWFGAIEQQSILSELLTILGSSGIGGERSVGYGHFSFFSPGTVSLPEPQTCAYLLSRWHPRPEEITLLKNIDAAYKLEAVEGWLRTLDEAAAQRRKRVWLVSEGSLIMGNPQGEAVNVAPDYNQQSGQTITHAVYRCSFALTLDWKRKDIHE